MGCRHFSSQVWPENQERLEDYLVLSYFYEFIGFERCGMEVNRCLCISFDSTDHRHINCAFEVSRAINRVGNGNRDYGFSDLIPFQADLISENQSWKLS